jgi:type VI protein secretion system component Hcp
MAKAKAMKGRKETRKIRDLAVKPAAIARVKGGATTLLIKACATGAHIKKATLTV